MNPLRIMVFSMVLLCSVVGCARAPKYELTVGLFELCYDGERVLPLHVGPTMDIPHDLGQWESWGFFIQNVTKGPFDVYAVLQMPEPPRQLGGEWAKYQPRDAVAGMKSDVRSIEPGQGKLIAWGLDDDDPLGEYSLEIFVGGSSAGTYRYHVTSVERNVDDEQPPRTCSNVAASLPRRT